jgi:hypothetical protein
MLQLNAEKASGGWRPLCMLETTAKLIDALFVRRKLALRSLHEPGRIYSAQNIGGEMGYEAATEVLYLNALVVEDAQEHELDLLIVALDFPKFFNTTQ